MSRLWHRLRYGHSFELELKYAMGGAVTRWCGHCGRMLG